LTIALKTDLHGALDAFRADPQAGAQALIDLHTKVVGDLVTQNAADTLRNQHKSFNDTRTQWKQGLGRRRADRRRRLPGPRCGRWRRMRDQFVSAETPGNAEARSRPQNPLMEFLRVTGAGDHPAFGRFLHNVARAFDEPALPPTNPKPRTEQRGKTRLAPASLHVRPSVLEQTTLRSAFPWQQVRGPPSSMSPTGSIPEGQESPGHRPTWPPMSNDYADDVAPG